MTADGVRLLTESVISAGGVVYRQSEVGIDVLLCGRDADRLWALPKGTPEPGETIEQTALREVCEETGLGVSIEDALGTIEYRFARPTQGKIFEKTVYHYLMSPTGSGSVDTHDTEYDCVRWFSATEALRTMTHANEVEIVRRAIDVIEARATL